VLTNTYAQAVVPIAGVEQFQEFLYRLVPFDPAKGEEGVSAQGALLIVLLILLG
jgi:hypothetical protein